MVMLLDVNLKVHSFPKFFQGSCNHKSFKIKGFKHSSEGSNIYTALCARNCFKSSSHINSFYPNNKLMDLVLFPSSSVLYKIIDRDTEAHSG